MRCRINDVKLVSAKFYIKRGVTEDGLTVGIKICKWNWCIIDPTIIILASLIHVLGMEAWPSG